MTRHKINIKSKTRAEKTSTHVEGIYATTVTIIASSKEEWRPWANDHEWTRWPKWRIETLTKTTRRKMTIITGTKTLTTLTLTTVVTTTSDNNHKEDDGQDHMSERDDLYDSVTEVLTFLPSFPFLVFGWSLAGRASTMEIFPPWEISPSVVMDKQSTKVHPRAFTGFECSLRRWLKAL